MLDSLEGRNNLAVLLQEDAVVKGVGRANLAGLVLLRHGVQPGEMRGSSG